MHDVKVIWEFWPFNHMLLTIDKNLLDGYSWNWLNNFLSDFFNIPRFFWNLFFEVVAFPINWFFDALNFIGNVIWSPLDISLNIAGFLPWLQRVIFWPVLFPIELLMFGIPTVLIVIPIVTFLGVFFGLGIAGIVWGTIELIADLDPEADAASKDGADE